MSSKKCIHKSFRLVVASVLGILKRFELLRAEGSSHGPAQGPFCRRNLYSPKIAKDLGQTFPKEATTEFGIKQITSAYHTLICVSYSFPEEDLEFEGTSEFHV